MISNVHRLFFLIAFALFFAACDGDHDLPEVDCDTAQIPSYADLNIIDTCVTCHSSQLTGTDRFNAPVGIDYDTYDDAVANAEHGVGEVFEGKMPPVGTVPEADKEAFYAWGLCGTPQ